MRTHVHLCHTTVEEEHVNDQNQLHDECGEVKIPTIFERMGDGLGVTILVHIREHLE